MKPLHFLFLTLLAWILSTGCSTSFHFREHLQQKNLKAGSISVQLHQNSGTVWVDSGNLLDSVSFSIIERQEQLMDFIKYYKAYLSIPVGVEIEFVADTTEVILDVNGIVYSGIYFHQSHMGIKIFENEQQGIFNAETGELKLISINLYNTDDGLDSIQIPSSSPSQQVDSIIKHFLEHNYLPVSKYTISSELFYSSKHKICGLKIDYLTEINDFTLSKIIFIVNP